ncbi:MAG: CheR family methyltransferase [Marinirhabdus sp.]|nr:CheR family methyltransferase [Marinirhabdus sp.]
MGKDTKEESSSNDLYVVGVGASAGGLDAITKFLSSFNGVKADFCVVVVMHLSPEYKSELSSILNKRCKWPVKTVTNTEKMQPHHIYVTPHNSDVHLDKDTLHLDALPPKYAHAPSIDIFFQSLAETKKTRAVGIVLSGFGSDGTKGIRAIKQKGGFTIAQLPETAEHPDMPKNAIQSNTVDVVIPAEQMFDEIEQYITNSYAIAKSNPARKSVEAIFELLERRSGTDFSLYKPSTIMRRINHRMANLQIETLIEYYSMIKNSPKELDVLFETVLIGVTEFYRDKKAFHQLQKHLETMLEDKKPGDSIRIWSVGCATGEEPYSIAILLDQILGSAVNQYHIQIFASDIDERALNFGRKGVYREESLKNLDKGLVKKYFSPTENGHFQISKEIKQHALFTRHDISNDPPFVKLDLVVCRNLLIYFNNDLQKQSLQIFHYALRPKGMLFLGKSESVSAVQDLFSKSDSHKIFFKAEASLGYDLRFSRFKQNKAIYDRVDKQSRNRNMSLVDAAKETLYYKYRHPFVIVNEQAEIKEVHGSLRMYLEIGQGTMNANLYKMANQELVTVLKAVHAQVKKTGVQHQSHIVKFNLYGNDHYVQIRIVPFIYEIKEAQYFLVIFEKIEPSEQVLELQKKLETADFVDLRIKELEDELATNREHLQIFMEELETTNEELQTINEELQSANEELKSSNEELETSNEELQSANEELNTANYELRVTNESLIEKEKELKAEKAISEQNELIYRTIAENIPDGSVGIVNEDLVLEFRAGRGTYDDNPKDWIGKRMPDLNPSKKEAKRLERLCKATLEGVPGNMEVVYNGRYYVVKTVLFEMPNNMGKKILYLSQEVTTNKRNQIKLETALDAANVIVVSYDYQSDRFEANKHFSEFLEYPPNKRLKQEDYIARIHPDDLAKRNMAMNDTKGSGHIFYEVRLVLPSGTKHIRVSGRLFTTSKNEPINFFKAVVDISEDKKLLAEVKRGEERFKNIADAAPLTIWVSDQNMSCTYVNKTWLEFTGSSLEDNMEEGYMSFVHPDDLQKLLQVITMAYDKKIPFSEEYRVRRHDGEYRWFLNDGVPIIDANGEFRGYIGSNADITERKLFTEKLEQKVKERTIDLKKSNDELIRANLNLEEYAYVASHDLQEPLRKIRTFNSILKDLLGDQESVGVYSDKIEDLAERMTELIKGILTYGELSKEYDHTTKVDLDVLAREVKEVLSEFIKDKNAVVTIDDLGTVVGDKVHMYQLFVNLIKNGIKFNTEHRPTVEISASVILGKDMDKSLGANAETEFKVLKFHDNGIGIEKEHQDEIFKPFKRLYSKSEFPGTGIGLAICKSIVDLHQGCIQIKSTVNKGSTFLVYIPMR